jgi:hypothetical protein
MQRQLVVAVCIVTVVASSLLVYFHRWDDSVAGGGDSWGYYTYLPSLIIHQDLKDLSSVIGLRRSNFPSSVFLNKKGEEKVWEATNVKKARVLKYTYCLSVFYLPGFLLSHGYASVSPKYENHGYSLPYIWGLYLSSFMYGIIGLIFLGKTLHRYFFKQTVFLSLLIIGLGTNLLYFLVLNNVMAHPILFFLWALIIYYSDKYWEKRRNLFFYIAIAACSAVSIIRPSEIICFLIPFFWGGQNFSKNFEYFSKRYSMIIWTVFIGIVFLLPQVVYWKYTSGQWLFDSYPGENFNFLDPHLVEGLFGFKNGWLPYSPLMILSLIGMILMIRSSYRARWVIAFIFFIHVYIIYSWWNWDYINGFGSRPMVELYPLLSFPMAFVIEKVRIPTLQRVGYGLIALFIGLNIFQLYQHEKGILWTEYGNLGYYLQSLGQTSFTKKMSVALDMNEFQSSEYTLVESLYSEGFEQKEYLSRSDSIYRSGNYGYHIQKNSKNDFYPVEISYTDIFKDQHKDITHLFLSMDVYVEEQITSFYDFESIILEYVRENGDIYKRRYLRLNNKPGAEGEISIWWGSPRKWDSVEAGFRISSRFRSGHKFRFYFNKQVEKSSVFIDNLQLYSARK